MNRDTRPRDSSAVRSSASPLIVDALNYLTFFCPAREGPGRSLSPWELTEVMKFRVQRFLRACASAKTHPTIFVVDSGWASEENERKWRQRRAREVSACERDMPLYADSILCEFLAEAGATVARPHGVDADDAVAWMAWHSGGHILSGDRDMFRYGLGDGSQRVAANFAVDTRGALVLLPHENPVCKRGVSSRPVADLPFDKPLYDSWIDAKQQRTRLVNAQGVYRRGCSCPFVRSYGNLHGHARPLRQAAYYLMGFTDAVIEDYPEWDETSQSVTWGPYKVSPDGRLAGVLRDPRLALAWLANADPMEQHATRPALDKAKRDFARTMLVAEMVDAVLGMGGPRRFAVACTLANSRGKFPVLFRQWPPAGYAAAEGVTSTVPGGGLSIVPASAGSRGRLLLDDVRGSETCLICGQRYWIRQKECEWTKSMGYPLPKRCRPCRAQRKS